MTTEQIAKFAVLGKCRFAVGSPDKLFIRHLAGADGMELTEAQGDYLDALCWRYRKQLASIMYNDLHVLDGWTAVGHGKADRMAMGKGRTP
jgi:hypothetical protein